MSISLIKQRAGRKYKVGGGGIESLRKEYIAIETAPMGANAEAKLTGVPAPGTSHPNHSNLVVDNYEVEEGEGPDKNTLRVTVNYEPITTEVIGSGDDATTVAIEEWGWDDGTDERELTAGVDGTPVLNSARDPFESVPKVSVPAPVFTKVMKFKNRQSGWRDSNCKVNGSAVTIGAESFPVGTLLCTIAEKRIIGDEVWKYQYSVHLRFKSNKVKIEGGNTLTEIGWDAAVVDAGMRAFDENGDPKLIRQVDSETGKVCTVTSPALLDGNGNKLEDGDEPYIFRFQAYERASFPAWFYSEPTPIEEGL